MTSTGSGSITAHTTSHVRYTRTSSQTIYPTVYGQLSFLGSGPYVLAASTTALATTTIGAGSALNLSALRLTVSGDLVNLGSITSSTGAVLAHPVNYVRITDSTGTVVGSLANGGSLYVTLRDDNRNLDGTVAETVTIPINGSASAGSDSETVTLTETSASSGIFRNTSAVLVIQTSSVSTANGTFQYSGAGTVTAAYADASDGSDTASGSATLPFTAASLASSGGGGGGSSLVSVFELGRRSTSTVVIVPTSMLVVSSTPSTPLTVQPPTSTVPAAPFTSPVPYVLTTNRDR